MRPLLLILLAALIVDHVLGDEPAAQKPARQAAASKLRRLIFNNDGNEPVYSIKQLTAEDLLSTRTTPLAGSQVDAIFYCTWSSGFSLFTHDTKAGQVFAAREGLFKTNKAPELLAAGIDPMRVMTDFAHRHQMESFWSFRLNDTHDGSLAEYGPLMFAANKLKRDHPEWLFGKPGEKFKFGIWSSVDYAVPQIREMAFRYVEEVAAKYDIDGIEIDFFRHASFFKRPAVQGGGCNHDERKMMTDLMRRIRARLDELGAKRGRPILIAVRVPDSVEYCGQIGIDLETWLGSDLVDLMAVSGYAQFNEWEYSVALGKKYGVKVYPSLDEPRLKDKEGNQQRASLPAYRGRAAKCWAGGADGVYMFNYFNPKSPLWHELGDAKKLATLDKDYFVSVRGVGRIVTPHQPHVKVQTLTPDSPLRIAAGKKAEVRLRLAEDFGIAAAAGLKPAVTLRLRLQKPKEGMGIEVDFNGHDLSKVTIDGDWLSYTLDPATIQSGDNLVEIDAGESARVISDVMAQVRFGK